VQPASCLARRLEAVADLLSLEGDHKEAAVIYEAVAVLKTNTPPAAQRQWVGLTDDERGKVYADWRWSDGRTSNLALCEAIEAKLKEKNNG
jgi:hypothetical protein